MMKHHGRGWLSNTRLLIAAAGAFALPAHAGQVCADAAESGLSSSPPAGPDVTLADRQTDRPNDIDFVRTEIVQSAPLARSDSVSLELVSLNRDVLHRAGKATRLAVGFSGTPALEIRSVLCVRSRPELLGLELRNNGPSAAGGLLRVDVTASGKTVVRYTRLPMIPAGRSTHILLSSSNPLSDATAISLHLLPKGG